MVNENLMNRLNALGFGADVDALESYVANLQDAAAMGEPIVSDDIYDEHYALLRQLRPDSAIVNRNWESEENELEVTDELLKEHGMASITTMKSMSDMSKFKDVLAQKFPDGVRMHVSYKLNGHGVRAVYRWGKLVGGSARGRSKKGRDLTRHMKAILPNDVPEWAGIRLLEVRGEMLVSLKNFDRYFRETLKTPLSAVTSLVRDSVTDEELRHLDMLCYKIYVCNESPIKFDSLSAQYEELKARGFRTPDYEIFEGVTYYNLDSIASQALEEMGEKYGSGGYEYYCDGLVASVDDAKQFEAMGYDGKNFMGNMALKIGPQWGVKIYTGVIESITFVPGKKYLTPKANIAPVKTISGPEVTTVPLYNIGVMEDYGLVPGAQIHFTFGGETGVTLVDSQGRMISEK